MTTETKEIILANGKTLIEWLTSHGGYISESNIQVVDNVIGRTSILIYTNDYCYRIVAKEHYLGCTVTSRRARPGENWHRGNDLVDGPFARVTYDRIMGDIVGYELKEIAPPVEQEVKPPAVEKIENTVIINQAPEA